MKKGRKLITRGRAARMIREARRVFWCVDYDGTLVPIVRRPEEAVLAEETRRTLLRLEENPGMRLAVVSGRPLKEVRRAVGLNGVTCAGNHGLEIRGPGIRYRHPAAAGARPDLERALASWEEIARLVPGAWVEDKGLTLTFHYRQVSPARRGRLRQAVVEAAMPLCRRGAVRLTAGKMVIEMRPPADWGKGDAVRYLLGRWGFGEPGDLAVAAGDDETDRAALAEVAEKGLALYVGARPPREANCRLESPAALRRFIESVY